MNWEEDNGLKVEDYQDMEMFKRKRLYPLCDSCSRKYVRTEADQVVCIPCVLLKDGLKYVIIHLIEIDNGK